ncbi:hypothetical protein EVAR_42045_1 [Eumeta japonica]|uniref:Uncharacterized protein n=1 Tax=Eumeta variegata TaxID=151549 RepID=A0A4C1Y7X5_EUMVA|nr:hypothetical protein EVAR_42045_1 [Eumeta japonica]
MYGGAWRAAKALRHIWDALECSHELLKLAWRNSPLNDKYRATGYKYIYFVILSLLYSVTSYGFEFRNSEPSEHRCQLGYRHRLEHSATIVT